MVLEQETAAYQKNLDRLMKEHAGKFVLIHGETIHGFWDNQTEAIHEGYRRLGVVPFLVRKIGPEPRPFVLALVQGHAEHRRLVDGRTRLRTRKPSHLAANQASGSASHRPSS